MNRASKLNQAFGSRTTKVDESADFMSKAEEAAKKKASYKKNGEEKVAEKTMCLSLSARQEEAVGKLSIVLRKSKSAIVRDAIDMYLKRHQRDIDDYDMFFGNR